MSNRDRILEFGDFSLDTGQRVLWRHGKRVPLSPKPMAMLLMLVENRHRVVTRDELMEEVWAGVIVEESNIATNIARLRRALANGEAKNGDARQYIETVSGHGYQFVAEVRERENEDARPTPPPVPELGEPAPLILVGPEPVVSRTELPVWLEPVAENKPRPLPFYRKRPYLLGFVTLLVMAAIAAMVISPKPSKPPLPDPTNLRHCELASWANRFGDGQMLLIRPSPDGQKVAYSKSETDQTDIFIQEVKTQSPVRVTSDPWPDFSPVWSPDGTQLGYLSDRGNNIEVAVIDLLTRERKVVGNLPVRNRGYRLLRWSKKAPRLIYTDEKNVFAVSLNAPETTNLTKFKDERDGPSEFGLSWDEEKIAYIKSVDGKRALFAARLDGSNAVQLIHAGDGVDYPEWFADNEHIVYGSLYGGAGQVSAISSHGGEPTQLTIGRETASLSHLSQDGKRIFYTVEQAGGNLFRSDLKTGEEIEIAPGPGLMAWPEVAPDGKRFVFQRANENGQMLHGRIFSASPAEPNRLPTELAADGFDARWSPNGEQVAFLRQAEKGYQLWLREQQNVVPRLLTAEFSLLQGFMNGTQWQQPANYSWSPSGKLLAYSLRAGGITNLMTISPDGQNKTPRSHNADPKLFLISPLWSPDETRIAYLAQKTGAGKSERSIVISNIISGGEQDQTIFRTDLLVRMIGWAGNNTLLAGVMEPSAKFTLGELTLERLSLSGKESRERIGQQMLIYLNTLRLSPDGKTLAFTARQNDCDNVWLYSLLTRQPRQLTANNKTHLHLTSLAWLSDGSAVCFSKQSTSTSIWVMEHVTDAKQ
ncbi:MAG TPA: winged helix-turn-helix domain-containing protein [Blastocatellia bacterium]|nr:winged helix-turn-helix domain-containing protein [Blastocatellia bacterium]HMV85789.1 winged helix-turn-helix domain-containing protein [Blastocatellia bacterium]HNG32498.1 winged helix-turn-helix domain-containing protein [Blastocatellia bacterium]